MEKYNDFLLYIVINTKNAKNQFSNLGNIKKQTGVVIGCLVKLASLASHYTYGAKEVRLSALYSRIAATHGVQEIDDRAS